MNHLHLEGTCFAEAPHFKEPGCNWQVEACCRPCLTLSTGLSYNFRPTCSSIVAALATLTVSQLLMGVRERRGRGLVHVVVLTLYRTIDLRSCCIHESQH